MSPELLAALEQALQAALPIGTAVSLGPIEGHHPALMGGEIPLSMQMVAKRRLEFMAGRAYAREALATLGLRPQALPTGSDRAPIWPVGIVGSISHAGKLAVAAAAPIRVLNGIGIDVEPATPLDRELMERVCRPEELTRLQAGAMAPASGSPACLAKLIFSAKESVYKCVAPRLGIFLEFVDVEILPGSRHGEFWARGHGAGSRHIGPESLVGCFIGSGGYWVTAAWQPA